MATRRPGRGAQAPPRARPRQGGAKLKTGAGPDLNAALIDRLIAREGGFVDDPSDEGGPTKYGITLATLRTWRREVGGAVPDGAAESREAIRSLTRDEARAIYASLFLKRHRLDEIHAEHLREHVLDAVVMHRAKTAVRWLQRAAGVTADGVVGPVTLAAVNTSDDEEVSVAFFKHRMVHVADTVAKDPRRVRFLRGWTRRALSFI